MWNTLHFRGNLPTTARSRLNEGPKNISPPCITLNILLGNFLSVQSVKPLLVNMAHSNAIQSFLSHGWSQPCFHLRNPLKLCSASAEDMGNTINNLTSVSTWSNRLRTSGGILFQACTASAVVLTLNLFLNMASWTLNSSSFSSEYLRTAASFVRGVRNEFSSSFNVWMPGCINLSVICASTVSRTR